MEVNNEVWRLFRNGEAVINCRTEEEAITLLKYCDKMGMEWCNGDSLVESTEWGRFGERTCYQLNNSEMEYARIVYYKSQGKLIKTFEDLFDEEDIESIECIMLVKYTNGDKDRFTLSKGFNNKNSKDSLAQKDLEGINHNLISNIGSIIIPTIDGQVFIRLNEVASIEFKLQ